MNFLNHFSNRAKTKGISVLLLTLSGLAKASGSVSSVLQQQSTEVKGTVAAVTSWVMAIVGLVALVQAILIFTSSQGTGEEKIKKAGTWIFMIVFCAVGFVIVKALFPA